MSTVVDTTTTSPFVAKAEEAVTAASLPYEREAHRLADTLLPVFSGSSARCILLMDLGGASQLSLWLASAVGSVLASRLKSPVHVLSRAPRPLLDEGSSASQASRGGCVLEYVTFPAEASGRDTLVERLGELRASETPVLLHAGEDDGLPEGLLQDGTVDSVVLLVHASRTRRASLQATVQRLAFAGVSPLGCVLLDRRYPIPEKLYHLL